MACWQESNDRSKKRLTSLSELLNKQNPLVGIRSNFVFDAKGNFAGVSNSSRDVSNELDRQLLIRLRSLADVIVTDAATARSENYRPSKWVPIQIWSKSGNFDGLIARDGLTLHHISNALEKLKKLVRENPRVLLEAGPTLTRVFAMANLIDELKLTLTGVSRDMDAKLLSDEIAKRLGLDYLHLGTLDHIDSTYFLTLIR